MNVHSPAVDRPSPTRTSAARGAWLRLPAFLFLLLTLWVLPGCGDDKPNAPDDGGEDPPAAPELVADSVAVLDVADLHLELDRSGNLFNARLASGECGELFASGLWIGAGVAGSPRGNIVWDGDYPWSNYTSKVGDEYIGPYVVTSGHLANEEIDWPTEHGFPVNESEEPVLYGDAMIWSALRSDDTVGSESAVLSSPIEGLEMGMSLFAFANEELDRVLFLRWDVTNRSGAVWEGVYVGLYSDTDLSFEPRRPIGNLTGYLPDQGITYTYPGDLPRDEPHWLSGFAFLTTPTQGVPQHKATSHRVMIKNGHPDYGEDDFTTAEQILWALQGRTKHGDPMIDPTSDAETLFAFSGDPLTGQGWIDSPPRDVRGMISSGPFSIGPDETKAVFAVWCLSRGENFASALGQLQADVVRARREAYRLVVGRAE